MPYKDPERKKQWEREHRAERTARRKRQRVSARMEFAAPKPAPDPASDQKPRSRWKAFLGLAIGLGFVLLATLAGIGMSRSGEWEIS